MIKYKILPEGSEKWVARDWERWYKEFRQRSDEVPSLFGRLMHKGLEMARRNITTQYLTGPRPSKLGVVTGRLRSSIGYQIQVQKNFILGVIGTKVWYARLHEEGTTFLRGGVSVTFPTRPFIEPGLTDTEDYIDSLFQTVGFHIQKAG